MTTEKQSVFMQMHNGERTGEGSFNVALKELFYKADAANRHKLVGAFPEFFGDEVPEFGVKKANQITEKANATFKYNGWLCEWHKEEQMFLLYTPDELEQPKGFRQVEFECETKDFCKQFIDTY